MYQITQEITMIKIKLISLLTEYLTKETSFSISNTNDLKEKEEEEEEEEEEG